MWVCGGAKLRELCISRMPLVSVFVLSTGNPFRGLSLVGMGCSFSIKAQLVPSAALLYVHP